MVDCTLDDYIGQKGTFSVQLPSKSVNVGNNFGGSGGFQRTNNVRGGFQRNLNVRGAFQKKMNIRGGFQQNGSGRGFQNNNNRGGFQRNTNLRGGLQRNTNVRGGFQRNTNIRGGLQRNTNVRGGFQTNTNLRGGFQTNTNVRGGFQTNTNIRGGFHGNANIRGGFQGNANIRGGFQGNANNNANTNFAVTGLGNVKSFDARLRLGPKVTFDARQRLQKKPADVRQKITGPGSNIITLKGPTSQNSQNVLGTNTDFNLVQITPPGLQNNTSQVKNLFKKMAAPENDARSKILKIQIQKGKFDARSLITSKGGDSQADGVTSQSSVPQVSVSGVGEVNSVTRNIPVMSYNIPINKPGVDTGTGLFTKTVTNVANDNCITLTNSGLQVTRSVPASSITFDGSSLKVTKRAHTIESSDSAPSAVNKAPAGIIHFSQSQYSNLSSISAGTESDDNEMDDGSYPMKLNITRTANFVKTVANAPPSTKPGVTQTPGNQSVVRSNQSAVRSSQSAVRSSQSVARSAQSVLKTSQPVLKRKSAVPVSSGPLKLLKTGDGAYTPSVRVPSISRPTEVAVNTDMTSPGVRKHKPAAVGVDEDNDTAGDVVNPLQGYRVYVTNLHPIVNQDDIIELFGAIGALKKAKLIKQGVAEVVYLNKDDAQKAVVKYNNRELDGQVMMVKLLTSAPAAVKKPAPPPPAPVDDTNRGEESSPIESKGQPLKLRKQLPVSSLGPEPSNVQLPVLHKALFKLGASTSSNPVTFTVKI